MKAVKAVVAQDTVASKGVTAGNAATQAELSKAELGTVTGAITNPPAYGDFYPPEPDR